MANDSPCCSDRRSVGGAIARGAGIFAGAVTAAAAAWILYSKFGIHHELPLPEALAADRDFFFTQIAGKVSYYHDRGVKGTPLVLVHSINAAASAHEMAPLFEHYRKERPVFALDLPGFGFSERSPRRYSPAMYAAALTDFLQSQVGEPADVVALSLSAEFAARAAAGYPKGFRSLTMISPTGFNARGSGVVSQRAYLPGASSKAYSLLAFALWGRPLFDLLTTRRSIEFFMQQSFEGVVPQELVEYAYISAHQPGAEHAPLHFLAGDLFTPDMAVQFYEPLEVPSLVIHDHDRHASFDMLPGVLHRNPGFREVKVAPTQGLPHFERPIETFAALDEFWKTLG